MDRNYINIAIVTKLFQKIVILKNIWEHTLGRNHINAAIVTRLSYWIACIVVSHLKEIVYVKEASPQYREDLSMQLLQYGLFR